MILPFELLQHAAVPAAEALVAGLWQGIALALVTGLVLRLLPGTSAAIRFAVWTAVFCASAAMPLAHFFTANAIPIAAISSHIRLDPRWSYVLAGLWIGAAFLRLTRLIAEAVSLRKLWREAQPLAPEILEAASFEVALPISIDRHPERGILRQTGSKDPEGAHSTQTAGTFLSPNFYRVQVCSTPDVDRPSVIGFFAPKILIPDWLCAQLSPTELRHIVLHEMEHLRRRDDWLNLLQKIGLVLFPLNPAMFWIDRRLSTEREIACDDGVLARTNTPRAYAASLTSIAERRLALTARRRMVALALGAFGTGKLFARRSEFARRIESILNSSGDQRAVGRPVVAAFLVAAIIGGSAAISHAPNLVSFHANATQNAVVSSPSSKRFAKLVAPQSTTSHFENASFHLPASRQIRMSSTSIRSTATVGKFEQNAVSAVPVRATLDPSSSSGKIHHQSRQAKPQWLVLTSWEQSSPQPARSLDASDEPQYGDVVVPESSVPFSRVVVRTPDGRFFATPYAAVPTQAGWLIVQL